jgi:pterin-4a-carbinolamine dehydratase
MHSHLNPLKSFGWSIRFIPHTDDRATVGVLTNTFPLAAGSPDIAHKFVNDVYALTAAEKVAQLSSSDFSWRAWLKICSKHHPNVLAQKTSPNLVFVELQTHSATPGPDYSPDAPKLQWPGVTLRDVRMAILIQQLYNQSYWEDGPAVGSQRESTAVEFPKSASDAFIKALRDASINTSE